MLDIEKRIFIVESYNTIIEAWNKIEINHHRSVIIVEGSKAVGTLSDGDIRKALLDGRLLTTPVKEIMNTNFFFLKQNEIKRASRLFKENDIFLIPIIDDNFFLLDIIAI